MSHSQITSGDGGDGDRDGDGDGDGVGVCVSGELSWSSDIILSQNILIMMTHLVHSFVLAMFLVKATVFLYPLLMV